MKTFKIYLVLLLLLTSCSNNSYPDYHKWCNEKIEKEKVLFSFTINDTPVIYESDTTPTLVFGSSFYDGIMDRDIKSLSWYVENFEVSNISCRINKYTESRCKPTFEGYNEWLKNN